MVSALGVGSVAPSRAGRREWAALAVLMLPVLLVAVDNTVLSLALPEIAGALRPSAVEQLWLIDVYPLVLSALLLLMGTLGDRFGRRRVLLVGALGFGLVSAAAAFAPTAGWLIAARAGMGFFGAMLMPSTLGLLRSTFLDPGQRRLAIAVWAATFSGGAALGPLVGGLLLDAFAWWGVVFLLAVPVLVPLLLLAPRLVPESRNPRPGRVDLPSIPLSMLTLTPLVLAIKEFAAHGASWLVAGSLLVGLVAGWVFVARQRVLSAGMVAATPVVERAGPAGVAAWRPVPSPMLDLELFARPAFRTSVLVNMFSLMTLTGFLFFVSQHLQLVLGLSPTRAALVLLPGMLAAVVSGLGVVKVVARVRAGVVVPVAVALSSLAFAVVALAGPGLSTPVLMAAFALLGLGVGAAETVATDLIIAAAPSARVGAASAVSEMAYEVGSVLGTTLLGSLVTASYRAHLVLPDGLPAPVADAARETLGGAVAAAGELTPELAATLLQTARVAFESGITLTAGLGAVVMATLAVLAARGLRGRC